jgi:hypothetical protein
MEGPKETEKESRLTDCTGKGLVSQHSKLWLEQR